MNALDKMNELVEDPWDSIVMTNKALWNVKKVTKHRMKGDDYQVKVVWNDPNKTSTWIDLYALAIQDPTEILKYARHHHLLSQKPFHTVAKHCVGDSPSRLIKAFKAKVSGNTKKYRFGIRVPFGIKQAMQLDKENGNTYWFEAIKKELDCLSKHQVFKFTKKGERHQKATNMSPTTLFLM